MGKFMLKLRRTRSGFLTPQQPDNWDIWHLGKGKFAFDTINGDANRKRMVHANIESLPKGYQFLVDWIPVGRRLSLSQLLETESAYIRRALVGIVRD